MLAILYNVLQINKDGMKCLSFFDNKMVRWPCSSDMNSVTLYKNQAGTFKDHSLLVESDEDKVNALYSLLCFIEPAIMLSPLIPLNTERKAWNISLMDHI